MSRLEHSGHQDQPNDHESAEELASSPAETVSRIGQELRRADPTSPVDQLDVVKNILELPETTYEEWIEKMETEARLTKALSFSLFDETSLSPDDVVASIRQRSDEVTRDVADNTPCSFTAIGQHMFVFALGQGPDAERPATQTKKILDHYNENAAQLDDQARAEGGIGYASALAVCGSDFNYQSGIIAHKTLAAADRHRVATGQEVLSPGEKYVLGGILERAHVMASSHYTGSALKAEAWAELQAQDRSAAQCFANMDAALAEATLR